MMNGLRKFEVKYSGDPELQPICSFENPALVRLFYKLSTHLNEKVVDAFRTFSSKISNSAHLKCDHMQKLSSTAVIMAIL